MSEMLIKIHEIATDGLPDMTDHDDDEKSLVGRVAFIFDGCVVSGWPLDNVGKPGLWEGNDDVSHSRPFYGVTHWVEFPVPVWELEQS